MAKRPTTVERLASPFRAWTSRLLFLLLGAAAFGFILLSKSDVGVVERARTAVDDALTPMLEGLMQPVTTVNGIIDYAEEMAQLRAQNADLRLQNDRLLTAQAEARELRTENARLRDLLNFVPDPKASFATARVIGDRSGPFSRSILAAAGEEQGVTSGMAALSGQGLVGRVVKVGERSSRVLLLTDINSRIPVLVGEARHRAVLVGDNTARPRILYLHPDLSVARGDYVVTSGDGGAFPVGLPVGWVSGAGEGGIEVQPLIDWDHLEVVRLVDYGYRSVWDSIKTAEQDDKEQ